MFPNVSNWSYVVQNQKSSFGIGFTDSVIFFKRSAISEAYSEERIRPSEIVVSPVTSNSLIVYIEPSLKRDVRTHASVHKL